MLTFEHGNLLNSDAPIIAHGCNAKGVMGSGVARAIREAYPKAYEDYRNAHLEGKLILGMNIYSTVSGGKTIANCITQEYFGNDGDKYVSYDAVDSCMTRLSIRMVNDNLKTVAMPMIGAGLGGGRWEVIREIIMDRLRIFDVEVWYL